MHRSGHFLAQAIIALAMATARIDGALAEDEAHPLELLEAHLGHGADGEVGELGLDWEAHGERGP